MNISDSDYYNLENQNERLRLTISQLELDLTFEKEKNKQLLLQLGEIQDCIAEELHLDWTPTKIEYISDVLRKLYKAATNSRNLTV